MAYVPPHRRQRASKDATTSPSKSLSCSSAPFDKIDQVYCINLARRPDKWRSFVQRAPVCVQGKVQRFNAIDGRNVAKMDCGDDDDDVVHREWDTTMNARYSRRVQPHQQATLSDGEVGCALSHIALWKKLASDEQDKKEEEEKMTDKRMMMILEDDAEFSKGRLENGLEQIFAKAPPGWDILYLGFSDRGQRTLVVESDSRKNKPGQGLEMVLFRPEYGFHTHAYILTRSAAKTLLDNLPLRGPLDVWLADNNWFNMKVYCAVIAGEGWRRQDGSYEGGLLVRQNKRGCNTSDIVQSAHTPEARNSPLVHED